MPSATSRFWAWNPQSEMQLPGGWGADVAAAAAPADRCAHHLCPPVSQQTVGRGSLQLCGFFPKKNLAVGGDEDVSSGKTRQGLISPPPP